MNDDLMTVVDVMQLNTTPILVAQTEVNPKPTGAETDIIIFTPEMNLGVVSAEA